MDKTSPSLKQKNETAGVQKNAKKEKNQRFENYKLNSDLVKEGNKRLQETVLSMLEEAVNPQHFLKQVRYLNPDGYEDIVEERSITSLCGYPMCGNRFTDKYGNRKYIIRSNKVYDITKRRKFCSDICFGLSEYVGNQIDSSPLYLREEEETEIKDVKLPQPESIEPRYGHVIDVTGGLLDLEDDDLLVTKQMREQRKIKQAKEKEKKAFSCISDVAIDSLIQCSENKENKETKAYDESKKSKNIMKNTFGNKSDQTKRVRFDDSATNKVQMKENLEIVNSNFKIEENKIDEVSERLNAIQINNDKDFINDVDNGNTLENELSRVNENVSKHKTQNNKNSKKSSRPIHDANKSSKLDVNLPENTSTASEGCQKPLSLDAVHQVEQYLREWMTFETLQTILGDNYVRGMLEHLGHSWEDYDSVQGLRLGMEAKTRYISLCRKLDREEQQEFNNDVDFPEENLSNSRPSGSMPDYQKLAFDTKQKGHKVVAFLQGKDCYANEKEEEIIVENDWPDANKLGTIAEETETDNTISNSELKSDTTKKKVKAKKVIKKDTESVEPDVRLPTVDSYAQKTWRRQIVMEKLRKILGELSTSLGLLEGELRRLLAEIIATFDLTPHNIMLKPGQWSLVALALLQMLSVRYKVIESAMHTSNGHMFISMILEGYGLDRDYLQRLLTYVTQVNYIISKYQRNTPQYAPAKNEKDKRLNVCGECQIASVKDTNESNIVLSEKVPDSVIQMEKKSVLNNQISKDDIQTNDSQFGKLIDSVELVGTNAEELD